MAATLAWRIFLRSLLVQSSWNFQRMQSLGFFLMVWPALQRRYPRGSQRPAQDGLRHLKVFNTHPYFAGLVAGAVLAEEERGAEAGNADGFRQALMCALGAVGDEFFWAALRPFSLLAALPAALLGFTWAPLVALAVFDLPQLGVRAWGTAAGLARGREILATLQKRYFARALPLLGGAILALAGFIVGAFAAESSWGLLPGRGPLSALAGVGVFALFTGLLARGLRPERLLGGLLVAAAGAGILRVVFA